MTLTPATIRTDAFIGSNKKLKCGPGSKACGNACIPKNHKCRASWNKPVKVAAGATVLTGAALLGTALFHPRSNMRRAAGEMLDPMAQAGFGAALTAGGIAAVAYSRRRPSAAPRPSTPSGPPRLPGSGPAPAQARLPGLTPKALLRPAPLRKSKTQRMRENTATAVRSAEQRIGQTAREEVRRIAQIGNTMAITGEATGMAAKTTLRELRLRTEAARRKYEPGYRKPDQRRLPGAIQAQLPERDPATGQPRRRKVQGFG
jgi:hypothetical protein